jgi:hypothetical protein
MTARVNEQTHAKMHLVKNDDLVMRMIYDEKEDCSEENSRIANCERQFFRTKSSEFYVSNYAVAKIFQQNYRSW